jgi:hypothetical protein
MLSAMLCEQPDAPEVDASYGATAVVAIYNIVTVIAAILLAAGIYLAVTT